MQKNFVRAASMTPASTDMNTLNSITPYLFNPYTGTILFVVALGYIVRAIPFISNRWIPLLGIVLGSLFFLIVAPLTMKPDPEHAWNWYVMIWGVGLILSAFAWLIHLTLISRLEGWARDKFPAVDAWFEKTSDQAQPGPNNPDQSHPK